MKMGFPRPGTKEWDAAIFKNQTEILLWLKSRGHRVDDATLGDRKYRSCERKKKFIQEPVMVGFRSYKCDYCDGWHLATDKEHRRAVH